MTYRDSALYITNKHMRAQQFRTKSEAVRVASELNTGRPEFCKPFRVEMCGECERFHVRRGKEVYVKAEAG